MADQPKWPDKVRRSHLRTIAQPCLQNATCTCLLSNEMHAVCQNALRYTSSLMEQPMASPLTRCLRRHQHNAMQSVDPFVCNQTRNACTGTEEDTCLKAIDTMQHDVRRRHRHHRPRRRRPPDCPEHQLCCCPLQAQSLPVRVRAAGALPSVAAFRQQIETCSAQLTARRRLPKLLFSSAEPRALAWLPLLIFYYPIL
eukprot:TRINITY_DN4774_c0_g1_i1.p2 TRINITY_DN4774_c0_g1~~TRINITY_DN4774_c0_g1_i1.p2  ORF type:complete len:198 (+),score=-3.82 TRINITY_DN4774_c0_g1_i1:158-751(+)